MIPRKLGLQTQLANCEPKKDRLAMSIQKSSLKKQEDKKIGAVRYYGNDLKFHFLAKNAATIPAGVTVDSPQTVLAFLQLPVVNFRKRTIVFKQTNYVIPNWSGDNFPSVIYVTADGESGLLDSTMAPTDRLAALQLVQFVATLDESQQRTYDLKYQMITPFAFSTTASNFCLRLQIDDDVNPVSLPLPNPISLHFEIRTQ